MTIRYNQERYNEKTYGGVTSGVTPPPSGGTNLSLFVGPTDWTSRVTWKDFKFSFRQGVGVAATFGIEVSDVVELAPTCSSQFILTMPTGEKFVLVPTGIPQTLYRYDAHDTPPVIVYTYDTIDIVSALDRVPIPVHQFIESTAQEIITTLVAEMNSAIDVSGVATGNDVPYLDTNDFVKFSDVVKAAPIATGGYTVQIDPTLNNGFAIKGDFKDNFSASGIAVDKDSGDFTPQKEPIVPDTNVINYQRVKSTKPGPDHTGMEFREIDLLNPSFKLKTLPYGLDGTELINFQIDDGSITGADTSGLPNVIPLHYPVQIEVADISINGGAGELFGVIGRNNTPVVSVIIGSNTIGAKVAGISHTQLIPFVPFGHAPDIDHQYYYDWYAVWTASGLEVSIVENYLNNLAGETPLATVTAINQNSGIVTISLLGASTVDDIPTSIRFFDSSDPTNVRGFSTIKSRSGSAIEIDSWPTDLAVGDKLASSDSASVTITEKTIYSGAAPANRYGKPQLVVSNGGGVTARQWTASYGPAIDAVLLDNPYTGAPGRRLRVDTVASRSTDLVIAKSGNTAICTIVGERLPLRGVARILLNYDVAKIIDVTVQDSASISRCGIRQGDIIESDAVLSPDEATALGQSVLDEFANPKPKGTITRESWLTTSFPCPNYTADIDVPTQYGIDPTTVSISDVSVDFGGYDWEADEGVLIYQISLGNLDLQDAINRQLLANQVSTGLQFRPLSAPGSRISSASWNDVDAVSIGVSGTVSLNGKTASSTFNPADYAVGDLREAPVALGGAVTSGEVVGELLVEIIYPPLDIDAASVQCHYHPKTNLVIYRWGRPPGFISGKIKRKVDDGTNTDTLVYKQVDEIFNEQYSLPYEPASKSIEVLTVGLGDKEGAGGYIELTCVLPPLVAPTTFDVVKFKHNDTIVFEISPPPTGSEITGRAKFLRVLISENPASAPTVRADFPADDDDVAKYEETPPPDGTPWRMRVPFVDTEADDTVYAAACWVDGFLEEGLLTTPFDATAPPMSIGSISTSDFFRSDTQANGGTVEDDNELTGDTEFTGVFRYHLGHHNSNIKPIFEESNPMTAPTDTPTWSGHYVKSNQDVSDADVTNGYIDIELNKKFRMGRKKWRAYRPVQFTVKGVKVHERIGPSLEEERTREMMYLVGFNGSSFPAVVPHVADGYFNYNSFVFVPGVNGLANTLATVTGGRIKQIADGFKYAWDNIDDVGIRRYMVVFSTTVFGTKGPGTDSSISTALNAIAGQGAITVYEATNTTKNVSAHAVDVGKVDHLTFHNGDIIDGVTFTAGSTYYVSVLGQKKNGRWSTAFATIFNTASGQPAGGDTVAPGGTLTAPTIRELKRGGLKIDLTAPTTGNLTLRRSNVYVANGNHSTATLWLSGSDLTSSTATESVGVIQEPPTGGFTIPADKAVLEAIFGTGATISVYATWTNDIGTSGFSSATTYNLATGETGAVPRDPAAPSTLATPVLEWDSRGGLMIRNMRASVDDNTITRYFVVVYDNSTTYFDFATKTTAANEAAARFDVGLGHRAFLGLKKKKLTNVFGSSGTIYAYYYAENAQGVSSASANSAGLSLATTAEYLSDNYDAARVIDVSALMSSPQNLIVNGDFGFSTATSTTLNKWRMWFKSAGVSQANTLAITTTSSDLIWDQTNHCIKWQNIGVAPVVPLRGLVPGDYFTVTFLIKKVGSVTPDLRVKFVRGGTTTDDTESAPSGTIALTTSYVLVGARMRLSTGADGSVTQWLEFDTPTTLDTSNYLVIDRVSLTRGKQPHSYMWNESDDQTVFFAASPAAITSPDVSDPSVGIQGGFIDDASLAVITLT